MFNTAVWPRCVIKFLNLQFSLSLFFFLFSAQSAAVSHPEDQTAENILASVTPGKVKTIVKKVADEVLGNFQVCINAE